MKSFIPWIDGKSLLAKKITEQFPDNIDRYIEVFGGGGSVLFCRDKHADLEVYNDLNSDKERFLIFKYLFWFLRYRTFFRFNILKKTNPIYRCCTVYGIFSNFFWYAYSIVCVLLIFANSVIAIFRFF